MPRPERIVLSEKVACAPIAAICHYHWGLYLYPGKIWRAFLCKAPLEYVSKRLFNRLYDGLSIVSAPCNNPKMYHRNETLILSIIQIQLIVKLSSFYLFNDGQPIDRKPLRLFYPENLFNLKYLALFYTFNWTHFSPSSSLPLCFSLSHTNTLCWLAGWLSPLVMKFEQSKQQLLTSSHIYL